MNNADRPTDGKMNERKMERLREPSLDIRHAIFEEMKIIALNDFHLSPVVRAAAAVSPSPITFDQSRLNSVSLPRGPGEGPQASRRTLRRT